MKFPPPPSLVFLAYFFGDIPLDELIYVCGAIQLRKLGFLLGWLLTEWLKVRKIVNKD